MNSQSLLVSQKDALSIKKNNLEKENILVLSMLKKLQLPDTLENRQKALLRLRKDTMPNVDDIKKGQLQSDYNIIFNTSARFINK